jgi:hypothetical protein
VPAASPPDAHPPGARKRGAGTEAQPRGTREQGVVRAAVAHGNSARRSRVASASRAPICSILWRGGVGTDRFSLCPQPAPSIRNGGYLQFRRCEMQQHRCIAAETAHRFRRDQDLVILRGAEIPNGRAVKDHPLRAKRPRSAASPAGENQGMIDTESLDRLEQAPGDLRVGQVQGNARIEIVRIERGALPIREGAIALDGSTEAGKEVRGQRSANADRDWSAIVSQDQYIVGPARPRPNDQLTPLFRRMPAPASPPALPAPAATAPA